MKRERDVNGTLMGPAVLGFFNYTWAYFESILGQLPGTQSKEPESDLLRAWAVAMVDLREL